MSHFLPVINNLAMGIMPENTFYDFSFVENKDVSVEINLKCFDMPWCDRIDVSFNLRIKINNFAEHADVIKTITLAVQILRGEMSIIYKEEACIINIFNEWIAIYKGQKSGPILSLVKYGMFLIVLKELSSHFCVDLSCAENEVELFSPMILEK